jgi:hypothetical protein
MWQAADDGDANVVGPTKRQKVDADVVQTKFGKRQRIFCLRFEVNFQISEVIKTFYFIVRLPSDILSQKPTLV